MKRESRQKKSQDVARMGLLFALAICLSFLESLLPAYLPVPGIKLGLSNVVTMYAVLLLSPGQAFALAALKGLFALFTRGLAAACLSFGGGVSSVIVMLLLTRLSGKRVGYGAVSMAGAVAHNVGQLAVATVLLRLGAVFWYYLPVLVIAGIGMGLLTALLLRAVMPWLRAEKTGSGRREEPVGESGEERLGA